MVSPFRAHRRGFAARRTDGEPALLSHPAGAITVNPVVWYVARTVWINSAPGEPVPLEPPASEFEPFEPDRYSELTAIPDTYRPRLREIVATGRRPLMFVTIPHVLVAGPIDVSAAEVVDPAVPPDWEAPR